MLSIVSPCSHAGRVNTHLCHATQPTTNNAQPHFDGQDLLLETRFFLLKAHPDKMLIHQLPVPIFVVQRPSKESEHTLIRA